MKPTGAQWLRERAEMLPQLETGRLWTNPHVANAMYPDGGTIPYLMGHGARLHPARVEAFFDGELSCQELVILAQDAVESGRAFRLGPRVLQLVQHCVEQNLITLNGGWLQ